MKNQYVADINDFRKYGLIRALLSDGALSCGIFWLLTTDDMRNDGQFLEYLDKPERWKKYDAELFHKLHGMVHTHRARTVTRVQQDAILPNARYVDDFIPDNAAARTTLFQDVLSRLHGIDVVFFDPDNGLEIKSRPYGRMNSSKFLFFHEVKQSYQFGHSLLIYQHFPREERQGYMKKRVTQLKQVTDESAIFSFATSNVCFFLIAQAKHHETLKNGIELVRQRWGTQFDVAAY